MGLLLPVTATGAEIDLLIDRPLSIAIGEGVAQALLQGFVVATTSDWHRATFATLGERILAAPLHSRRSRRWEASSLEESA